MPHGKQRNRRLPRLLAAAPGAVAITALLCLLATVGGMEQGSITLGAGCVRGVIFLTVFAAASAASHCEKLRGGKF